MNYLRLILCAVLLSSVAFAQVSNPGSGINTATRSQINTRLATVTGAGGDNYWYADVLGVDTARASAVAAANASPQRGQIIKVIAGIPGSNSKYQTTGMNLTTTSGAAISIECGETSELPGHQIGLLYVGTPGGIMVQKDATKFNSGAHITNCIFDGNAGSATAAGRILALDAESRYTIMSNVFQGGSDSDCVVCVGMNTSTTTYENLWLHNKIQTNTGISGRWATVPVTVSGGTVIGYGSVSDGGSYCNNAVVAPTPIIVGCTTPPAVTVTMSGSNTANTCSTNYGVTGVSGTGGSGCDNTNTILHIPELQQTTAYGWHSKDQTDYLVEDLVVANVGQTAAELIEYGAGTYIKEHPYVGQPIGIIDSSPDTEHFAVELDSIIQFGVRPSGYNQNWWGISQVFNTGQNPQGYKKFAAIDFVSGHKNIHVYGLTCGSTAAAAGTVPYRYFNSYFNPANPNLTDLTGQGDTVEWSADCTAPSTPFIRKTIGPDQHYGPFVTGTPVVSAGATAAISATTLSYINSTRMVDVHVAVTCNAVSSGATITPTITYTDPSSTVQTVTGSAATCTTLGSASVTSQNITIRVKGSTNIQVSTAIAGSPTYDFAAYAQERTSN